MIGKMCVVTTQWRGVFVGVVESRSEDGDEVTLADAQLCVSWSSSVRGWIGLAATGPDESCRVSTVAPRVTLRGVTSVAECTAQASDAWRAQPWK